MIYLYKSDNSKGLLDKTDIYTEYPVMNLFLTDQVEVSLQKFEYVNYDVNLYCFNNEDYIDLHIETIGENNQITVTEPISSFIIHNLGEPTVTNDNKYLYQLPKTDALSLSFLSVDTSFYHTFSDNNIYITLNAKDNGSIEKEDEEPIITVIRDGEKITFNIKKTGLLDSYDLKMSLAKVTT